MTELAFHGIHTSRSQKSEKCNPCVRYEMSPMSRAAQILSDTFFAEKTLKSRASGLRECASAAKRVSPEVK
ncbi:hypothetical protein ACVWW2_001084 [Bradyrhizobium sp. LM4.3]